MTWAKAQAIISAKLECRRREHPKGAGHFLYNGFLFCAKCGGPIWEQRASKRHPAYYVCRNRKAAGQFGGVRCDSRYLDARRLEDAVDTALTHHLTSPEFVAKVAHDAAERREHNSLAQRIVELEDELCHLEAKRSRVLDLYVEGIINMGTRDKRLAGIDTIRAAACEELERAKKARPPALIRDEVVQASEPFMDWPFLGRNERRELLSITVPRILVHNYEVTGLYRLWNGGEQECTRESEMASPAAE